MSQEMLKPSNEFNHLPTRELLENLINGSIDQLVYPGINGISKDGTIFSPVESEKRLALGVLILQSCLETAELSHVPIDADLQEEASQITIGYQDVLDKNLKRTK